MKTITSCLLLVATVTINPAATTINNVNKHAYGANIGWLNAQGDVANGAIIGESVCSGYIWGANIGWIHLGDGTPVNNIRYQNNSASDYGVNHDGLGNLRGLAYGANIGWINLEDNGAASVDLKTGNLSGFVWSANCGWISLSNAFAQVQTDTIQTGEDSDLDGITDSWELTYTNTLTALTAATDTDGDGVSDLNEYGADTNPLDANDFLRITDYSVTFGGGLDTDTVTWSSKATRCYVLRSSTDLSLSSMWLDATGFITPDPGPDTTRMIPFASPSPERYFQVRAFKPLTP